MKKIILMTFAVLSLVSCADDVNVCPTGPYKKHSWKNSSIGTGYYIEQCEYCDRHRRNHYDRDTYDYEDMETGSLSIEIKKSAVNN